MRLIQQERFSYLFDRFYNKTYSPQERQEFLHMVASGHYQDLLSELTDVQFQTQDSGKDYFSSAMEEMVINNVLMLIAAENNVPSRVIKINKLLLRVLRVAAVLLIIGAGVFCINYLRSEPSRLIIYSNDVPAGRSGATLTLANGRKIMLSQIDSGQVVSLPGLIVRKSSTGKLSYQVLSEAEVVAQENELSTQNGETFQLDLPDGTKVWLNAASRLSYSTGIHREKHRLVKLEGEAYFEVAKDAARPFVVESATQKVEVLGTHFNVNAYPEDPLQKTTLLEGSVRVLRGNQHVNIEPGFQTVNSKDDLTVQPADLGLAVGWKNGQFVFENQNIIQIMKTVARWYNVEVIYSGDAPEDLFSGAVSRGESISHVLTILESTERVHFKVDGLKIFVSK